MSLATTTDKAFWHGYLDFYEQCFGERQFVHIAEIGVLRGHSVRWWLQRFPRAQVYGADILPRQPQWPSDARFHFTQLDQGERAALRAFFAQAPLDLILEDGSHQPAHQALALVEGLRALQAGGLYILEDVHTSHPAALAGQPAQGNAFTLLLALDHFQRLGRVLQAADAAALAQGSLFSADEVAELAAHIARVRLYRRTRLPERCYRCEAMDFDYARLRCRCGVALLAEADSMSFVIDKR